MFTFLNKHIVRLVSENAFIVALVILAIVGIFTVALVKGTGFEVGGVSFSPTRQDVVSVKDTAQLIRQDASQRAILLVPRQRGQTVLNACSEPPPDVAQNLAQSLNSSLEALGKKGGELEANVAAKVTSDLKTAAELIFQRSQGIQLLRDTMFRLCEALQNGVIEREDYREMIQTLISTANFIIPFEQCTGMARANQGQIASEALNALVKECLEAAMLFSKQEMNYRQDLMISRREQDRRLPPTSARSDSSAHDKQ
jgi:hypothetical protein